jgi:hypothetical protein
MSGCACRMRRMQRSKDDIATGQGGNHHDQTDNKASATGALPLNDKGRHRSKIFGRRFSVRSGRSLVHVIVRSELIRNNEQYRRPMEAPSLNLI